MWERTPFESQKLVPDWFHFPLQAVTAAFVLYWHWHLPAPNKAVLALAAVAALMVLGEMRPVHKAIYFVLIISLVFTENHAINKDRSDFAQAEACRRKEENDQFSRIGGSITTNVQKLLDHNDVEFSKTMARSDAIIAGVGDAIKTQTGGDSFAFITFTLEPGYVQFNQFPPPSNPYFLVSITSHGRYPLREVHARMWDPAREFQALQHPDADPVKAGHAGDTYYEVPYLRPQSREAPSGDVLILGTYPIGAKEANDLSIAFSSPNGNWDERLHLRRVNGTWLQALTVIGPTVKQMKPFVKFDPGYPDSENLAQRDWPPPSAKKH
jgi:hypothetical protein